MHFFKTDSSTYPLFLSSSLEKYRKLPLLLIPLFFLWFSWYVSLLVERIWSSRYTLRCFYFLLKLFFCVTDDSNPLLRRCLFCSAFLSSVHNNIFLPSTYLQSIYYAIQSTPKKPHFSQWQVNVSNNFDALQELIFIQYWPIPGPSNFHNLSINDACIFCKNAPFWPSLVQ